MSVALYHYGYGNVKGARLMMQAAHNYLQPYRPFHWSLDLEKGVSIYRRLLTAYANKHRAYLV
ncbi:hypothetical protein GCM10020331_029220 [Ectobacillus funiculus]